MAFKIGFAADTGEKKPVAATYTVPQQAAAPRKSVVQIYFADRHMTLAYYNDQFDLHRGDMVYMKENGLNPDKYYKQSGNTSRSKSGSDSGSGTEGCYITSACVAARGLPDQCEELQTLRFFRDGYLSEQPGGQVEIEQYYANAPKIVEAINQSTNAAAIWNSVYEELVKPCVQLIHSARNEEAHRLYKEYALKLSDQYL